MDLLREWIHPYVVECVMGLFVVQAVLLILVIVNWTKFHRIRKQQKQLLRGMTHGSIEQLLNRYTQRLQDTERHLDEAAVQLDHIKHKLSTVKGNVGLVRYNALEEQGGDLSFSLAILDEQQNGLVLSSLYGRQQSYAYAKPLTNGTSDYSLSDQEKEAIALASGKKQTVHV